MDTVDAYDIVFQTVTTVLLASAPILIVALIVGLVISFLQAITQIQEMTLTFVPKIFAIFGATALTIPFMFATLMSLTDRVFDLIVNNGF